MADFEKVEYKFPDEREPEKKAKDDVEFEIEVVDDTPDPDKGRKPLEEPVNEVTDDELSKYDEGVQKRIKDIIDGVYDVNDKRQELQLEQEKARYEDMSEKQLAKELKQLEKAMNEHAKNLEFEKAAAMRDQLLKLRELAFGANLHDSVSGLG